MADQRHVQAQLYDQLYQHLPVGIIATVVNAIIVAFILWKLVSHTVLLVWLGANLVAAGVRSVLLFAYRQSSWKMTAQWWRICQVAGIAVSGTLWGATGIFLFPEASTAHQVFVAFVLAGMVAGAVGMCSSVRVAFVLFSVPALVPLIVRFFLMGDHLHLAMGGMTFLFLILTFAITRQINRSATELVAFKEHFAAKVAERTHELIRANEGLNREIVDRQGAEARIRSALREKELLLKEVHHRVKNNLAVIISILKMQSSRIPDPRGKEALQDCYDRVKAMALIHETLYQSDDLAAIPLADYARRLAENLRQMMLPEERRTAIRVTVEAEGVQLPIDEAMPCGLLLNELLTNSLKYAFANRPGGHIVVAAHISEDGRFQLSVRDDGVGLPAGLDLENPKTLGFRIISILVNHQMEGTWEAKNDRGAWITIQWPTPAKTGGRNAKHA
jgi:two-component sensor histidine kinase